MNKIILKKMCQMSLAMGLISGALSLIPFVGVVAFLFAICFVSTVALIFLRKNKLLGIFEGKESSLYGAIAGFVGFIGFSITMVPLAAVASWLNSIWLKKMVWLSLFNVIFSMGVSGFFILLMLIFLIALLAAMMNAFSAMITVAVFQMLEGTAQKKDEFKVDVEIE